MCNLKLSMRSRLASKNRTKIVPCTLKGPCILQGKVLPNTFRIATLYHTNLNCYSIEWVNPIIKALILPLYNN